MSRPSTTPHHASLASAFDFDVITDAPAPRPTTKADTAKPSRQEVRDRGVEKRPAGGET